MQRRTASPEPFDWVSQHRDAFEWRYCRAFDMSANMTRHVVLSRHHSRVCTATAIEVALWGVAENSHFTNLRWSARVNSTHSEMKITPFGQRLAADTYRSSTVPDRFPVSGPVQGCKSDLRKSSGDYMNDTRPIDTAEHVLGPHSGRISATCGMNIARWCLWLAADIGGPQA